MTKYTGILKKGRASYAIKWYYMFQKIKFEEQFSELLILCQYMFNLLAHHANVEHALSLINVQ